MRMTSWFLRLVFIALVAACTLLSNCNNNETPNPFAIDIGNSEIPYVVVDTQDAEIQFTPKIPATLQVYQSGTLTQGMNVGIEYRGKTSYRLSDKKAYNIETTDSEISFFGFPQGEDFRLLGHIVNLQQGFIFDRTLIYNYTGYELSRSIGRYASRCKLVELQLNGEYRGVYVFAEKLKRGVDRINIQSLNENSTNISGGYILKIDKADVGDAGIGKPLSYFDSNWDDDARYTESNSFRSRYDINRNVLTSPPYGPPYNPMKGLETYFLYEYPNDKEITPGQKEYIANYIDEFETALITDDFQAGQRTYGDYIDVASFVDYFILNELFRNIDAYRLSTFLQKDRDGKLAMGPIWDLDIGFDFGDRIPMDDWVINYNAHVSGDAWMLPFWWMRLMEDPEFRAAIKTRWTALRSNELSDATMLSFIDDTAQMLKDNGAVERNYQLWDQGIGVDYDQSIANMKSFLTQRAAWMDATIGQF